MVGWYEGKKSGVIGPKKKKMMMNVTHLLTMPHAAGKNYCVHSVLNKRPLGFLLAPQNSWKIAISLLLTAATGFFVGKSRVWRYRPSHFRSKPMAHRVSIHLR